MSFLFKQESTEPIKSKGFWVELFLLRCNKVALSQLLSQIPAEKLLQRKEVTREFFKQCVTHLNPHLQDLNVINNSLSMLLVFFQSIFEKKFVSRSSNLISLLAGYDTIDEIFFKFLDNINTIIRGDFVSSSNKNDSTKQQHSDYVEQQELTAQVNAIRTAIVVAGGSYNISLGTYFMNRDLFVSIVDFINSSNSDLYIGDAFSLIGLLAAFGKLETHNPYRVRLGDFVDQTSMIKTIQASGHVWQICLNQYLQEQTAAASRISSPLSSIAFWLGFGRKQQPPLDKTSNPSLSQGNPTTGGNDTTPSKLPLQIMSLTIATYEAVSANKVYARLLLECPASPSSGSQSLENKSPPFATFLSLCTFLFQNQHKVTRAALYSRLCLLILRIIVESPVTAANASSSTSPSLLVDDELRTSSIIVARQRAPYLPLATSETSNSGAHQGRLLIEGLLDALQCALRYNMKRILDVEMYLLALTTLFQTIHFLRQAKFQVEYHWSELWKTLMSLIRFINSHNAPSGHSSSTSSSGTNTPNDSAVNLTSNNHESVENPSQGSSEYSEIVNLIVLILATSLINGNSFLSNSDDYDDLFYKIIEGSDTITKLQKTFCQTLSNNKSPSMTVLQAAINHYSALLPKSLLMGKNSKQQMNSQQISSIIRDGYQTLSLYQYATTTSVGGNGNGGANGNGSGTTGLKNPSEVAAYLMYDPLPRLRESEERLYFKKLMKEVISDIQELHSVYY